MTLSIFVEQSGVTMSIIKNRGAIDSETTSYYYDLSDLLITTLDKLLKRNSIDPVRRLRHNGANRRTKAMSNGVDTTVLNSFKIRGNTGKNGTSYKIAAAFIEGLKVKV